MKFKKIVKKTALILTVIMLLAVGTVFSGYAATELGTVSFSITATGSKTFTNTSDNGGYIVDLISSYPTIKDSKYDYSKGYAYLHNNNTNEDYGVNTDYYVVRGNGGSVSVDYLDEYVPKGTLVHHWKNTGGGGFSAPVTTLRYPYG